MNDRFGLKKREGLYMQIGNKHGFVDIVLGEGADIPRLKDDRQSSSMTTRRKEE